MTMNLKKLALVLILSSNSFAASWFHIELGAANYGADGHTQKSQRMTVAKKLEVGQQPNYIDDLPLEDFYCHLPSTQYKVLFDTLDDLVSYYGTDNGVFHVNDLFEEYTIFAVERLKDYAAQKGYVNLVVEGVPGDYTKIDPLQTLTNYGAVSYDTAHLKNPEVSFFAKRMDGNDFVSTKESRCEARRVLQQLANLSKNGLEFTVVFHSNFVPVEEMSLMESGNFYRPSNARKMPYLWPEGGKAVPEQLTRVFNIVPLYPTSHAIGEACSKK